MIPSSVIEEIRNKAEIAKIISEYVQLKKRGKNYLGLCPFHAEKDPSFTVSPEKQLFHCFGCNEGGNVFAFIMKIENVSFAEAVAELGLKLGISVPRAGGSQSASRNDQDKIFQVTSLAVKYFQDSLEGKSGEAAQSYLEKRGISSRTRNLFALGFALPGWDNLFKYLISRGVAPALIEKSGLILARESQSGYYDRFRNRLIFPVFDHRNRSLAFGGRSLGDEEPKYLNSPETPLYHKGETVYGLNLSKDEIKKSKTAVLVEGFFDLITPFQAGITNIVASLGTALTVLQCKLLSRYSETVILAFDADAAGAVAAERSIELLRKQGLKVKVAVLTGEKDPDALIQKQGAKAFVNCLESALPFLEFRIRRVLSRHDPKEIESRGKALLEIAAILSQENDDFIQKEYAKFAAPLLKTDPDTILAEVKRKQHYKPGSQVFSRKVTQKPGSKVAEAEKNLIVLATQNREALDSLKKEMKAEDFKLPETRAIAELLFTAEFEESRNLAHFILENLADEGARKLLSRLLLSEHLQQGDKGKEILNDCLNVIKSEHLKNRIEALKLEIKEAEKAGETKKVKELLSALKSEL